MRTTKRRASYHVCNNDPDNLVIDLQKVPVMLSDNPNDWFLTQEQEAERDAFMDSLPEDLTDKLIKQKFRLVCRECFIRTRQIVRDRAFTLRHDDGALCIRQCGRTRDQWFKDFMMDLSVEKLLYPKQGGFLGGEEDQVFKSIVASAVTR